MNVNELFTIVKKPAIIVGIFRKTELVTSLTEHAILRFLLSVITDRKNALLSAYLLPSNNREHKIAHWIADNRHISGQGLMPQDKSCIINSNIN